MKLTIAEFAQKFNVSHSIANGVIAFLIETGEATKTDEIRPSIDANGKPKRGRPSIVFEISPIITITL